MTVIIQSSGVEYLQSLDNYSGGEFLKETKLRKRKREVEDEGCVGTNTVETTGS